MLLRFVIVIRGRAKGVGAGHGPLWLWIITKFAMRTQIICSWDGICKLIWQYDSLSNIQSPAHAILVAGSCIFFIFLFFIFMANFNKLRVFQRTKIDYKYIFYSRKDMNMFRITNRGIFVPPSIKISSSTPSCNVIRRVHTKISWP